MAGEVQQTLPVVGSAAIDTISLTAGRAQYALYKADDGYTVKDLSGVQGVASLQSIERLTFADTKLALDLQGNAGTAAKLIGAVFGKSFIENKAVVGVALQLLDGGASYGDVAGLAVRSNLFAAQAGSHTNDAFVWQVYQNVVGAPPPKDVYNYYTGLLDSHQMTQAGLAVLAAETAANAVNVGLVGLSLTGLEYA